MVCMKVDQKVKGQCQGLLLLCCLQIFFKDANVTVELHRCKAGAMILFLKNILWPDGVKTSDSCSRMLTQHIPCRSPAVPLPIHKYAFLKVTSQGRGRVAALEQHGNGTVYVNYHRPFRDGMLATCQFSASCCYHVEFQEVCYQKHTNLRRSGQCDTKQRSSWTRRSLLFWCKDMSACIIYSKKFMKTI
jgi:hypothetical protein